MSKHGSKNEYRDNCLEILTEIKEEYYKFEEIPLIIRFVEGYDPINDFNKICLSWNGCKSAEFKDYNKDFRDKVSIFICLNNDTEPSQVLLKDLVQEIGKASRETWGAPEYLFLLSERLLKETGGKYIETFGKMLFSSMDTYGTCLSIDFTDIDVKRIVNELKEKDKKSKLILDLIEYFEAIVKRG